MAYRLQERAASVGFDWPDLKGPLDKIREELAEVEAELRDPDSHPRGQAASEELVSEIGDLLFAVVNLARKAGVQPGPALDRGNRKFRQRFEGMERLAAERGVDIPSAGLETLDGLWNSIKREHEITPSRKPEEIS
jgi:uncharacterized protein YabN with tetrapyrrole methylase and pyrophosphatase domain